MPVNVSIKNYKEINTPEYMAGKYLKSLFESLEEKVSGEVVILSGLTIPGGAKAKDVDLAIMGTLRGVSVSVECKAKHKDSTGEYKDLDYEVRDVEVQSFFYLIELKDHPADRVRVDEVGQVYVEYKGAWPCATAESQSQKESMMTFLTKKIGQRNMPWIRNFVWLHQLNAQDFFSKHDRKDYVNVLVGDFTLKDIFEQAVMLQGRYPLEISNKFVLNDGSNINTEIFDLFLKLKTSCGPITRQKLELLTQRILNEDSYSSVGNKLTIIKGEAGTGKTVRLLQIAYNLAESDGMRCLILTYNHALASDIKRTIDFSGMPDAVDGKTVQVSTLHSFFFKLFKIYGIEDDADEILSFDERYNTQLNKLSVKVNQINRQGWDYVLVDEAQDWNEVERNIMITLFGKERLVFADGNTQFVRTNQALNLKQGLSSNDYSEVRYKYGLRQKQSLVDFVNAYALEAGLRWGVNAEKSIHGGTVIVTDSYKTPFHKDLIKKAHEEGNENYDFLFLCPSDYVKRDDKGKKHFVHFDQMRKQGIYLFDGTTDENRYNSSYSIDMKECRLFQYESCRGIEGWVVVCLAFDVLFKNKYNEFLKESPNNPTLARLRTIQWTIMPLTRAIDTLVLCVNDPDSEVTKILRRLYGNYSDIIEWK